MTGTLKLQVVILQIGRKI